MKYRPQLGILAHAFPPSRARSLAFATFSAGAPIGAVFGTAVGGILTEFTKFVYSYICRNPLPNACGFFQTNVEIFVLPLSRYYNALLYWRTLRHKRGRTI